MVPVRANATQLPLDAIFPNGLGQTRLLKLDVQGAECAVLAGGARALGRSPRLSAIATEVASGWLDAQCCGKRYLLHASADLGRESRGTSRSRWARRRRSRIRGAPRRDRLASQRVRWLKWAADRPWNVSCSRLWARTGGTCLAHPAASAGPGAGNLSRLRLGEERISPLLTPQAAGQLRARMQQCRESREGSGKVAGAALVDANGDNVG